MTSELLTRDAYEAQERARARELFSEHTLSFVRGHLALRSNNLSRGVGTVHFANLCGLVVGGDIDLCAFGSRNDLASVEEAVAWIGKHDDFGYAFDKARVGMNDDGALTRTDHVGVALYDLQQLHNAYAGDGDGHAPNGVITALARATTLLRNGTATRAGCDAARTYLSLGAKWDFESEDVVRIGRVPSQRVFCAHAAAQRAHALLLARKAEATPAPPTPTAPLPPKEPR